MLDHTLFDWVKCLPLDLLLRSRRPNSEDPADYDAKWILRKAFESRLPREVAWRPKHPFVAPPLVAEAAAGNNSPDNAGVRDRLEAAMDSHPYFDPQKLRTTLEHTRHAEQSLQVRTDPLWWTLLSSHAMLSHCHSHSESVPA